MLIGTSDIAQRIGAEFSPSRAIVEGQTGQNKPPESGPPPPPPPGLIGGVEIGADGQPSIVIAATVVGYVPPAGLMVQVQLAPTDSDAERAEAAQSDRADLAEANGGGPEAAEAAPSVEPAVRSSDELSDAEAAAVQDMQARDASVRQEEQAHAAAAGAMAGPIQYDHKTGPDGRRYVVNGRVSINYSTPSGDPTAAANAGRKLAAAAMAAQAPSAADYAAAAEGYRVAGDADRAATDQTLAASQQAAAEPPFGLSV